MNKRVFRIFIFCLALLMVACKRDKDTKEEGSDGEMTVAVAYPEVRTYTLTQNFPGNLEAVSKIDIMARVNGTLTVHVPSGSKVKKGQLLYSVDDSKYRDLVRQSEATLSTARSTLATAESNMAYYQKQYSAMEKAFKANAVSEMELLESKNNLDVSMASIENAKANIDNAQAQLDEARLMLGYCEIRAPFDGTLALQQFDQGAYINGETTPVQLNTIYDDSILYAYISVDEKRYAQMISDTRSEGLKLDKVRIKFNIPVQHEYWSAINYEAPIVSTSTGTVTLRFTIPNTYGELKSGMYMNVEFPYGVAKDALMINDASIGTDQQGKYVYVVNDDDKVIYTPVDVGELYQDTLRIVTKGLTQKSRYVSDAILKVRDGMKVKVKTAGK